MRDLYKILYELEKKKISFCLQAQGQYMYYNLLVKDIHGKEHHFHSDNMNEIEKALITIWGHLLKSTMMPVPPNFPMPGNK